MHGQSLASKGTEDAYTVDLAQNRLLILDTEYRIRPVDDGSRGLAGNS
jgi:hypothetical protein